MFTVISCYEVALRNAIDKIMTASFGTDWLRDAILPGGIFDNPLFSGTVRIMHKAYNELVTNGKYSCSKMLSAMEFGIWKYMFLLLSIVRQDAFSFKCFLTNQSRP